MTTRATPISITTSDGPGRAITRPTMTPVPGAQRGTSLAPSDERVPGQDPARPNVVDEIVSLEKVITGARIVTSRVDGPAACAAWHGQGQTAEERSVPDV